MSVKGLGLGALILGIFIFSLRCGFEKEIYPLVFNSALLLLAVFAYLGGIRAGIAAASLCFFCLLFYVFYMKIELASIIPAFCAFIITPAALGLMKDVSGAARGQLLKKIDESGQEIEAFKERQKALDDSLIGLDKTVSDIVNLYEITKAMSAALLFNDIFRILSEFLTKNFTFTACRLILVKGRQGDDNIEKVYKIEADPSGDFDSVKTDIGAGDLADKKILEEARSKKKIISRKNSIAIPLISQGNVIGILHVEGLREDDLDKFLIAARQFTLEIEKVQLYETVQELAITDGLTGVFTRRYFLERLKEEFERSAKHNFKLSFLMIDLDHFKECNDRFGHLVGDAVLSEAAEALRQNIREIDLLGRYGGEEFCLMLPETDEKAAFLVAERLRYIFEKRSFSAYDETLRLTISVGISTAPGNARTEMELIETADRALYEAKAAGRNRVEVFKT